MFAIPPSCIAIVISDPPRRRSSDVKPGRSSPSYCARVIPSRFGCLDFFSRLVQMTPQQPPFQCDFPGCGLSYRRKEHLTRHAKSHIQPRSYECPFCDRVYARNDTRRQHIRTHHKNKEFQSSRAIQACQYCRTRRSKCDGQTPCDACLQRGNQCLYSPNPRRRVLEATDSPTDDTSSTAGVEADSADSTTSFAAESGSIQHAEVTESNPRRIALYVEAYFDIFHPKWPFLHPATFDPDREPAFLLQSVIMIGLWVTGESTARQTAKDLHQKLTLSIYEQKVGNIFC